TREREAAERRAAEARAAAARAAAPAAAPTPAAAPPPAQQQDAPPPVAEAPPAAAPPRPAAPPQQTRTYQPSPDRRDDRPSTTTSRPERQAGRFEAARVNPRAPRADAGRPHRAVRGRPRARDDRGPRPAPSGDTVRYS